MSITNYPFPDFPEGTTFPRWHTWVGEQDGSHYWDYYVGQRSLHGYVVRDAQSSRYLTRPLDCNNDRTFDTLQEAKDHIELYAALEN